MKDQFFAGIGGWDYALQLAEWPEDRPICTASLPCQPFSAAGAGKGKDDERHLLPNFLELVRRVGFTTIFGEQVPRAIYHGWLDDLCTEMGREGYSVRAAVLTAAGAGAPHIRQRFKPGIQPLVDGLPKGLVRGGDCDADNTREAGEMRIKGYGNAIVPQVAAEFISSWQAINSGGNL